MAGDAGEVGNSVSRTAFAASQALICRRRYTPLSGACGQCEPPEWGELFQCFERKKRNISFDSPSIRSGNHPQEVG
jgi:hypothetical protein